MNSSFCKDPARAWQMKMENRKPDLPEDVTCAGFVCIPIDRLMLKLLDQGVFSEIAPHTKFASYRYLKKASDPDGLAPDQCLRCKFYNGKYPPFLETLDKGGG